MSEAGRYKVIADEAANQRREAEETRVATEKARVDAKASSYNAAKTWWEDNMAPEIRQAQDELRSAGVSIDVKADSMSSYMGGYIATLRISGRGNKFYPYTFTVNDQNVSAIIDYSENSKISAQQRRQPVTELSGSIHDENYASNALVFVLKNTVLK